MNKKPNEARQIHEKVQDHRRGMLDKLEKKLQKPYVVEDGGKNSALDRRMKSSTPMHLKEVKKPPTEEEILAKFKK